MSNQQKFIPLGQKHAHIHSTKEEDEDKDLFPEAVPAIIFDALSLNEEVSSGFNAVRICLDATLKSDLIWKQERQAAENYIKQGFRIFWEIQLGIFNFETEIGKGSLPIANQSQFLSLSLALEHFRNTFWKEFRQHTVGVCLYRGSADFSAGFVWNEEQQSNLRDWLKDIFKDVNSFAVETSCPVNSFDEITIQVLSATLEGARLVVMYCRNVIGKYLGQLSDRLPDTLQCYVLLDIQTISDALLQVQLTTNEGFSGINLGIKGPVYNEHVLAWEGAPAQLGMITRDLITGSQSRKVKIGVCLPPMLNYIPSKCKDLEKTITELNLRKIPFRAIPEASLTTDWDGLDTIIISSQSVSAQGQRKLQGFRAAGGKVVSSFQELGESLTDQEM